MLQLGIYWNNEQAENAVREMDTDGNGTIDFDELEVKLEVVTVSTTDDEPADDESADDASADDAASDDVELAISSLHHHGPISMTEITACSACLLVVIAIVLVVVLMHSYKRDLAGVVFINSFNGETSFLAKRGS